MSAIEKWASDLSSWAIPQEILDQAPEKPWIHPPALFEIPEVISDSPSHQRAKEVIPYGGSVLDIGCGGGVATFAITPPAVKVIGVDEQEEMLQMYKANAEKFGVESETFLGLWPEIETNVPVADVVVSHHVAFNVKNIAPFLRALHSHARKRVVIEIPVRHPMSNMSEGWKFFWNITRPTSPEAIDLISVLNEIGIRAEIEYFERTLDSDMSSSESRSQVRRRLCLPAERQSEVDEFLGLHPLPTRRQLAAIWWDIQA